MNSETVKRFGDCAALVRDTIHPNAAGTLPYIGLEHIAEGKLSLTGYGNAADVTSLKAKFVKGDILFGKLRPYFRKVVIAPFDGVCSTDIWVVRAKDGIDQRFLFYWMASPEFIEICTRASEGTKMPRAQWEYVERIEKPIPPLSQQRSIAHILGTLDDKIELNNRMNQTLEAMARALFKSWFVDFDPVKAKAAGKKTGLPKEIDRLFPSSFRDSELGKIPKGWTVRKADELYEVAIGRTPPRKESRWFSVLPADVPWMSIKDLGNAVVYISEVGEYLTADAVEKFRVRRIPENSVVLSFKLTVGRVAITDIEMLSNEAIAHFLPIKNNYIDSPYLYCYLFGFEYGCLGSTSSIATAVNSDSIRSIQVLVPDEKVHDAFNTMVKPIFHQLKTRQRESKTLSSIRDTLLPKLLSGEIKV